MRVTPQSRWVILVGLALAVGIAELVATLLVFTLLGILISGGATTRLPLIGDLRERLAPVSDEGLLIFVALLVASFFVVRASVLLVQSYLQNRVAHNSGVRLANRLVSGYLRMPYRTYVQRNSAELTRNAYGSVVNIVLYAFIPLIRVISEALLMIGIAMALLVASPIATLFTIAATAPVVLVLLRLTRGRTSVLGGVQQSTGRATLQWVQEILSNLRDIRILRRERFFEARFNDTRTEMARSFYLKGLLDDVPRVTIETLFVLFICAFLLITLALEREVGEGLALLGTFGYAGVRLLPSLHRIVTDLNHLRFAEAAVDDVHAELRRIEEWIGKRVAQVAIPPLHLQDKLELEGVSFGFEETRLVLRDVNLTVPRGSSIGIIGETGSGKSTLVDVMTGLLEPTSGQVMVDSRPVHDALSSWHEVLGVVYQSTFLLDDTIRHNIALGIADEDVDAGRLDKVICIAQLETFISDLLHGFETVVGERGIRLSGGQRQRIAIARALYRDPDVLIFDEATAALDNVTEAALIDALEEVDRARTMVMVAHRITSLRRCDQIVVLEKGRIIDSGTYEDLASRSALFGRPESQTAEEAIN